MGVHWSEGWLWGSTGVAARVCRGSKNELDRERGGGVGCSAPPENGPLTFTHLSVGQRGRTGVAMVNGLGLSLATLLQCLLPKCVLSPESTMFIEFFGGSEAIACPFA